MERKLATVLFADLVDSTELLAGVDPEIVRRRVSRFFDEVAHCIVTHGGTLDKFAGDAVMAAFGVPLAHEDDAERALRAALEIRTAVGELGLECRIGVGAERLAAHAIELEPAGTRSLRGFAQPVAVWRAVCAAERGRRAVGGV